MIGEKIKEARKAKGYTLKSLGAIIKRSHAALSQIENGINQPEKTTLILLGQTLNNNFGEVWLNEYLNGNESAPSRKQIIETTSPQEIFTLKFGGKNTRRSKKDMAELRNLLDRELEKMKEEEEKYGE